MRLVIARCTVDYVGRLSAHLPLATRLVILKADGSALWITKLSPTVVEPVVSGRSCMRVLPVKRISRDTEQSSALERQGIDLAEAIRDRGHDIAGWVEDATVSGAINLDQRPSLGKWLVAPLVHEWDALMVTCQDRISRDDMHWWSFVAWILANKKSIIILDDPSFDISTEDGRMIAGIKATQAAKYRKTVQQKRLDQTEHFRRENLWPGGTWPFGYRQERTQHNGKPRWRLVIDPTTGPLIEEAYDRLVNKGDALTAIARDWNARGIMTPLDHQRHINALAGRENVKTEVKGTRWATTTVKTVLMKPALMGFAMHKGEIRKVNGLPVVWADPILSREEWDKLQDALAACSRRGTKHPRATTPLVGVVYCLCGEPLYSNSATKTQKSGNKFRYDYYVCRTWKLNRCQWCTSWPKDFLQKEIERVFLDHAGDLEIKTRTFVPGVDRSSDIKELREAISNLTGNLTSAKPGSAVAQSIISAMEEHERALSAIEAIPKIPSRWIEEGTGVTFREEWNKSEGWKPRGDLLRKSGFRIFFGGKPAHPEVHFFWPEDLDRRMRDAFAGTVEPGFLERALEQSRAAITERREVGLIAQGPNALANLAAYFGGDDNADV